jgi:ParB family chromosome partitioning protein
VVGADAYRAAGGRVIEDLFGPSHIIGDEMLLKRMARQLLIARCDELVAAGWGWAEIESDLPKGARYWAQSEPKSLDYQGDEKARLDDLTARLGAVEDQEGLTYSEREEITEQLEREIEDITTAVRARSFEDKKRKTLGCIVDIEDGRIVTLYGIKKPEEVTLPDTRRRIAVLVGMSSRRRRGSRPRPRRPSRRFPRPCCIAFRYS